MVECCQSQRQADEACRTFSSVTCQRFGRGGGPETLNSCDDTHRKDITGNPEQRCVTFLALDPIRNPQSNPPPLSTSPLSE